MTTKMKLTSLLPWFGGKRTMAPAIVEQLGPHSYYFEGCAGSMAVLFAKEPSEHEVVCDLHGGMTNLAWVIQQESLAVDLFNRLQRELYSDLLYQESKDWLNKNEPQLDDTLTPQIPKAAGTDTWPEPDVEWAYHYFIASWMGRNGVAGTERVNYQIATRWTKGGGSGPLRFKNAVDSIPAWCERLRNVHILRRNLFDVLPKIEDGPRVALYADPPYLPGTVAGNSCYLHDFEDSDMFADDPLARRFGHHGLLALQLRRFKTARVVCSYYDAPELDEMYPGWTKLDCSRQKHLHVQNKRGIGKGMTTAPEVLLINGKAVGDG